MRDTDQQTTSEQRLPGGLDSSDAAIDGTAALPLTSFAILGLLDPTEEYTAVEVKARAHELIRYFYWTPALSHIRRELDRLDALGYVSARVVRQGRVKSTLKYRITEAGERSLRTWVGNAPLDPPVVKNSVLLRVWLGRRAGDKEGVLRILESNIDRLVEERRDLALLIERSVEAPPTDEPPRQEWSVEVLRHTLRTYDHMIESLDVLLNALKQLDLH